MSFNSHLGTISVVHSDRPKRAYLNPMSDPRIRPRFGFPTGGDGVWGKEPVILKFKRNDSMLTIVLTSSMLRSAQYCVVKVRYNGSTRSVIFITSVLVNL